MKHDESCERKEGGIEAGCACIGRALAPRGPRFVPMTSDRGRSWGVWDSERQTWQIVSYRFHNEEEAQERADYLNSQKEW